MLVLNIFQNWLLFHIIHIWKYPHCQSFEVYCPLTNGQWFYERMSLFFQLLSICLFACFIFENKQNISQQVLAEGERNIKVEKGGRELRNLQHLLICSCARLCYISLKRRWMYSVFSPQQLLDVKRRRRNRGIEVFCSAFLVMSQFESLLWAYGDSIFASPSLEDCKRPLACEKQQCYFFLTFPIFRD